MYATLADLKTAIQAETVRPDTAFVARLPEFVKMAEKRLFDSELSLRVREMETRATLTVTAGTATVPANFLGARRLTWQASRPYNLVYRQPEDFYNHQAAYGRPQIFTIEGTALDILARADGTATLAYYARPSALTSDVSTHSVLTAHGDCYLFACLIEAYAFLRNTAGRDESAARYRDVVLGANSAAVKARYAGTSLHPRIRNAV